MITIIVHVYKVEDYISKCLESIINQITSYRKILSFRMHSLIVALSYGIPCYGFVWDNKVRELFEKIGMPNSFCYPTEQFVFRRELFSYEKQTIKSKAQKYGGCSKNDLYNTIDRLFEQ